MIVIAYAKLEQWLSEYSLTFHGYFDLQSVKDSRKECFHVTSIKLDANSSFHGYGKWWKICYDCANFMRTHETQNILEKFCQSKRKQSFAFTLAKVIFFLSSLNFLLCQQVSDKIIELKFSTAFIQSHESGYAVPSKFLIHYTKIVIKAFYWIWNESHNMPTSFALLNFKKQEKNSYGLSHLIHFQTTLTINTWFEDFGFL